MLKKYCFILCYVICGIKLYAQITLKITNTPRFYTPLNDKIYIAGNFNNWNPSDTNYRLTKNTQGEWQITFTPTVPQLEFKFTRGSWTRVEVNANGNDIQNRTLPVLPGAMASFNVADWLDTRGNHTATGNTFQLQTDFNIPQLNRTRRIWIFLPEDYFTNTYKRYPVFYMQDGQNLFDNTTSFSGEWRIDETLRNLQLQQGDSGIIVVGIDNGGAQRINEYSPYVNPQYGGGDGEKFADFIAYTLKPYIDAQFRTYADRKYTAIGGSSMGALISFYATLRHQAIFSKCLVFSPSFWFSDSLNQYVNSWIKTQECRFYFMGGTNESTTMVTSMQNMRNRLINRGVAANDINLVTKSDGQHSEWFWAREFGDGYKWLFQNNLTSIEKSTSDDMLTISPNPSMGWCVVRYPSDKPAILTITTTNGKTIIRKSIYSGAEINVSKFPVGMYHIQVKIGETSYQKKLIVSR